MEFKINLTEKQKELREACLSGKYNIVFYGGAIRGGKTFGAFAVLMELALKYPYSRWYVVRKEYTRLVYTTLPAFKKFLAQSTGVGIDEVEQYLHSFVFRLSNFSEIVFIAENYERDKTLERFKGLEANGFLLEEVSELQKITFEKCIERAGTNNISGLKYKNKKCVNPKPLIICTANPARNWIKSYFYDRYIEGTLPDNIKYIKATANDNPYIDESTKKSWRSMSPREYKIYVEGAWDFDNINDAFYYGFSDIDNTTTQFKYRPDLPLHISIDENVRPAMHATVWQDFGNTIVCIDEFAEPNLQALTAAINERYCRHQNIVFIYGDATSKKADAKLNRNETFYTLLLNQLTIGTSKIMKVPPANPRHTQRYVHVNNLLLGKYGKEIKFDLINTKKTQADLLAIRLNEKGGKLKEKTRENGITFERHGHLSDTVDYFLMEYCKNLINKSTGAGAGINVRVITTAQTDGGHDLRQLGII